MGGAAASRCAGRQVARIRGAGRSAAVPPAGKRARVCDGETGRGRRTEGTLRRHAQATLALFESARAQAWTTPIAERVERCLPDIDNLRAALDWAAQSAADAGLHIALAGASSWIWKYLAQHVEGLQHCDRALARIDPATPPALEARLLAAWSELAHRRGRGRDMAAVERAIELYRGVGDRKELYQALGDFAAAAAANGRVEPSERAAVEMARLHDSAWPPISRWLLVFVHYWILSAKGSAGLQASYDAAAELVQLARTAQDSWLLHRSLILLNLSAANQGRFEEAAARGRELVALIRQERFATNLGLALMDLSFALTELGQLDEALDLAREAASRFAVGAMLWGVLDLIALLALKRGHVGEAALAVGRADAMNRLHGVQRLAHTQRVRDTVLRQLSRTLQHAELEQLLARGAALTDEEAARAALAR
jgi:tetratricopeptide (TPR) repeat protein